MDSIRDDIIFEARLKQWTDNVNNSLGDEERVSFIKKIYEPFESLPKPSTPKQAKLILDLIVIYLEMVEVTYDKEEKEEGALNIGILSRCIAKDLKMYIHDETKANNALKGVLCVRKTSDKYINSIVFNESNVRLREHDETGSEENNDENAKLKVVEIFHTMNIFAKNAFDAIHNAHRVKRLFKT
jgi:hypothetical protein